MKNAMKQLAYLILFVTCSLYAAGRPRIRPTTSPLYAAQLKKQAFDLQLTLWISELKKLNEQLPPEIQALMQPHIDDIKASTGGMQLFVDELKNSPKETIAQDAKEVINLLDQRQKDIELLFYAPVKQAQEQALKELQTKGTTTVDQETLDTLFEKATKTHSVSSSAPEPHAACSTEQEIKQALETIETRTPAPALHTQTQESPKTETKEQEVVPAILVLPADAEPDMPIEEKKAPSPLKTTAAISAAIKERSVPRLRADEVSKLTPPFTQQEIDELHALAAYAGKSAYQARLRNAAKKVLREHKIVLP